MNIGIIGSGAVARALGTGLANLNHHVMLGSRDPQKDKLVAWRNSVGANARTGTFAEAAAFGEVIILATLFRGTEHAIALADKNNFSGKIVIDTTNPIADVPPKNGLIRFTTGPNESAGEQIQQWIPAARVVKAFNIIGNQSMVNPKFAEGDPDMYICGNSDDAKKSVTELIRSLGWKSIIDLGSIESSRALEPLCMFWVLYGRHLGTWNHAIKMIH